MNAHMASEHSEHIVSSGLYWLIWAILIVCTVLTAWVATIDLGPFNTVVALTIATFKASLVVLIFMHVKYTSERMTKAILISALFWLMLLLFLSLVDYSSRPPDRREYQGLLNTFHSPSSIFPA
jgi:cytochrome c oxidase subunit 4